MTDVFWKKSHINCNGGIGCEYSSVSSKDILKECLSIYNKNLMVCSLQSIELRALDNLHIWASVLPITEHLEALLDQ